MSSRRTWACAVAALAALSAPARHAAADAPPLRWADVAAALPADPRLAAAAARVRAAMAAVEAAQAAPNPELEASAGRGATRDGATARAEWGVGVSLPLDWLARRGPEVAAARAGAAEAEAEAAAARGEAAADLWRAFVRAGYAGAEVEVLQLTERQVSAWAELVRRRVEAGEGRPVEIPRVELEAERVRGELGAARAADEGARAQLAAWLGAAVPAVALPPAVPEAAAEAPAAERPRLRAARARAEAARAEASAAARGRVPPLALGVFYASELDREAVGGRLTAELPLWDWKGPRVRRAEAAAAAEAARAEAERRSVAAAQAEAGAACARARALAGRQAERILPRAEQAARTLERTFELGETGLLDVIDARRVLLAARRDALASARERDLECGAHHLLSGGEIP